MEEESIQDEEVETLLLIKGLKVTMSDKSLI